MGFYLFLVANNGFIGFVCALFMATKPTQQEKAQEKHLRLSSQLLNQAPSKQKK